MCAGLLCSSALATAALAQERTYQFDMPAQPLASALRDYGRAADRQLIFTDDLVRGRQAPALKGRHEPSAALDLLLTGTDLTWRRASSGGIMIVRRSDNPQSGAAASYEGTEPPRPVEEVVVTGTHIRGNTLTPSPVLMIDRKELDERGVGSIPELLASIPQNFATTGPIQAQAGRIEQAGNIGLATGANLRGLGARATLSLIDGQRGAPTGASAFFDSSALPLAAIERVEILSDGASAIYGSDAVAGVVNYILKRPANEAETRLRLGTVTDGGYREFNISQTFGRSWASGGVLLAAEFHRNEALEKGERDFSRLAASPAPLVPRSETKSVFTSFRQDVGERASLAANYIYSDRRVPTAITNLFYDISRHLHLATVDAEVQLGATWTATLSGSYSQDATRRSSVNMRTAAQRYAQQDSEGWFFGLRSEGVLVRWRAGEIRAVIGVDYLSNALKNDSNTLILADEKSEQKSVFSEILVPLLDGDSGIPFVQRLDITLAGRITDYDKAGVVRTPKLGFAWAVDEHLKFRGTWGKSFRTPIPNEVSAGGMASFVTRLPDPTSPTGQSIVLTLSGANPDSLEPERATSWSLGFDVQPAIIAGLTLSANYFDYDYKDRIDSPARSAAEVVANPTQYARFLIANPTVAQVSDFYARSFSVASSSGVPLTPSLVSRIADVRFNNVGRTVVRGFDFDLKYTWPAFKGVLTGELAGVYYTKFFNVPTEGAQAVPGAGLSFTPPEYRFRASLAYADPVWSGSLAVNYFASYTDRITGRPDRNVEAWAPIDLVIARRISSDEGGSGSSVALIVRNLFDEPPPFVRDTFFGGPLGYDTVNADPLGRVVSIELRHRW